jgi:hypothetical protein
MDFAKFVSLVSNRALYFCNLEILAKEDPHEGLLSLPNYRHREWKTIADLTREEYKTIFFKEMNEEEKRIQFESQRNAKEYWLRRRFYDRRTLSVNCWHVGPHESAAMWVRYAAGGNGIAITTNYDRLTAALVNEKARVFVGMVQYLDWSSEPVNNKTIFPFSKKVSYAYEQELRLALWNLTVQEKINDLCGKLFQHTMDHLNRRIQGPINWEMIEKEIDDVPFDPGVSIAVDLEKLVDQIYISPTSSDWFVDIVDQVCKKFGLNRSPIRSDLLSAPIR